MSTTKSCSNRSNQKSLYVVSAREQYIYIYIYINIYPPNYNRLHQTVSCFARNQRRARKETVPHSGLSIGVDPQYNQYYNRLGEQEESKFANLTLLEFESILK